ncbi:dolichyl-phosphate beta-glucosyltransferase [Thermobaculum terrenum]|uniref:dolichyl-phosphate beta-glucosyltransferase n=1 Tax=Thermobaculum terrenum TaxID=166501 RepID=UPI00059D05CD|nr:dolichyl-phosphate beta-glucosyltransferase [Thermobaculum terrenum]
MRLTEGRPFISVIIPAYNEAKRLPVTIPRIVSFLSSQGWQYELIVVDDGSTDETQQIACQLSKEYPSIRLLKLPHRGKGPAVREGVLASTGDLVLFTDADLSTPISQLSKLLARIEQGYDIAIGSREGVGARRYKEPFYRHLMGRVFNLFVRLLTLAHFNDTQCGFKLFRKHAAKDIFSNLVLYGSTAPAIKGPMVTSLDVEVLQIAARRGYKVAEVPVEWHYSSGSKVRPALDSYRMLKDIIRIKLNDLRGMYDKK